MLIVVAAGHGCAVPNRVLVAMIIPPTHGGSARRSVPYGEIVRPDHG